MSAIDPVPVELRPRRPKGVWAISIWYLLSACFTVFSFVMTFSGRIPVYPPLTQYYASLSFIDYAISTLSGMLSVTGAVMLFQLRRQAFAFMLSAFLLNVFLFLYQADRMPDVPGALIGMLFGYLLMIGVLLYLRTLIKRGVLS